MLNGYKITMVKTQFVKHGTKWAEQKRTEEEISPEFYKNCTSEEAGNFMKRLGGYERNHYGYSCAGYLIDEISSISPDRTRKTLRTFKFSH